LGACGGSRTALSVLVLARLRLAAGYHFHGMAQNGSKKEQAAEFLQRLAQLTLNHFYCIKILLLSHYRTKKKQKNEFRHPIKK